MSTKRKWRRTCKDIRNLSTVKYLVAALLVSSAKVD
jgi:hypothetical protein